MKGKKIYIGIIAIVLLIIFVFASIFYIKSNNNDVEVAKFVKNFTNENTKEAMETTEKINKKSIAIEMITNVQNKQEEENKEVIEEKIEEKAENTTTMQESNDKNKEDDNQKDTKQNDSSKNNQKQVETPKKEIKVTPLEKTLYVNVDSLNIRSGPDTTYSRIGGLKKSAEVKVTGQSNDWYRISYKNSVGYVKASYLSTTKPVVEEPKVEVTNEPQTSKSDSSNIDGTVLNNLIIINSKKNTLRYYTKGKLSRSYSCATGTSSNPTPQGKFSVYNKIVNRPYYKANIPGGAPNNPLGKRWLGLDINGTKGTTYGIHGTNNEGSIGSNASHGCIRMHNADVEAFYDIVPVGTTVIIKSTSKSDKQIAAGYGIYIE